MYTINYFIDLDIVIKYDYPHVWVKFSAYNDKPLTSLNLSFYIIIIG